MTASCISNLISIIRNGQKASLKNVNIPKSKQSISILLLLTQEGFIRGFFTKNSREKQLFVLLKYHNGVGAIHSFFSISRVNKKIYFKVKTLWQFKNGLGIWVVSSSKGILTSQAAIKKHVGGCMLLKVA